MKRKIGALLIVCLMFFTGFSASTVLGGDGGQQDPNQLPVADAGGPYSGAEDESITFDGSDSTDPDGTINYYRWDWTNDGIYDTSWSPSPTAMHAYATAGSYTVRLQVEDNDGATDIDTADVTVSEGGSPPPNEPPIAVIDCQEEGDVGETITFDGSLSSDSDGTIVGYRWDFQSDGVWDYPGGSAYATETTATHIYSVHELKTVKLEVVDDDDAIDQTQENIKIFDYVDIQLHENGISVENEPCNRDTWECFSASIVNYGEHEASVKVEFWLDGIGVENGGSYMGTPEFPLDPTEGQVETHVKGGWVEYKWPNDILPTGHTVYAVGLINSDVCYLKDSTITNNVGYRTFYTCPKAT